MDQKSKLKALGPPISRILLRYGSTAAATTGLLAPDVAQQVAGDPDLVVLGSFIVGLGVEIGYARAKVKGGST